MKNLLLFVFLIGIQPLFGQTTLQKVTTLFQAKCTSCHDSNAATNGSLDLTGTDADVYSRIYMQNSTNAFAQANYQKIIYPGRPDRSTMFRRLNDTFEPTITLDSQEGSVHGGSTPLNSEEKELLRQWILFGAADSGNTPGEAYIHDYYNGGGQPSFPNGPPPAPAAGEGFQIKMGPFFLPPNGEQEWYQKYEVNFPANVEVDRINTIFDSYSHHFIMYSFNDAATAANIPHGMRTDPNHNNIGLVYAIQEPTDLKLPNKTAFFWNAAKFLDLNSHYINYNTNIYAAETYINVYTKPSGTAVQEMRSLLIPNTNIYIPNDQQVHTFNANITYNFGQIYFWGLMGHTHKYGTDYKMYRRNQNGTVADLIYDAGCTGGTPGCIAPVFDYKHIPLRYYDTYLPINISHGIRHTASYVNTGNAPVAWGPTSADEMMVAVGMFVVDTTGLGAHIDPSYYPLGSEALDEDAYGVSVFPNPANTETTIQIPDYFGNNTRLVVTDITGKVVVRKNNLTGNQSVVIARNEAPAGLYLWRLDDEDGTRASGKLIWID